jgi:hypothetical protein
MLDAIKFFAVPVILFLSMGYATLSHARGYDLPTDLVIESDCDVDMTTETVAINLPDAL